MISCFKYYNFYFFSELLFLWIFYSFLLFLHTGWSATVVYLIVKQTLSPGSLNGAAFHKEKNWSDSSTGGIGSAQNIQFASFRRLSHQMREIRTSSWLESQSIYKWFTETIQRLHHYYNPVPVTRKMVNIVVDHPKSIGYSRIAMKIFFADHMILTWNLPDRTIIQWCCKWQKT